MRWSHPGHGTIMPDQFIEIAEETGAILPIGHWVLRQACREARRLARGRDASRRRRSSASTSRRARSSRSGSSTASRPSWPSPDSSRRRLVLEITETALLKATPTTVATLEAVRALGVRTVIDDFGTGYFSLSHLRQFPVDALKIAKEFVQETDATSKSSALAGAIVAMSRSLGIETVAEGIETPEQAERMRELGCAFGQGYAFARPMLEADLLAGFGTPSIAGAATLPAAAPAARPRKAQATAKARSPAHRPAARPRTPAV